jgi:diguanylate cyclase (GGDEF)-like protein
MFKTATQLKTATETNGDLVETVFDTSGSLGLALLGGLLPPLTTWMSTGDLICRALSIAIFLAAVYRVVLLCLHRRTSAIERRAHAQRWERLHGLGAVAFVLGVGLSTAHLFQKYHDDIHFLFAFGVMMAGVSALSGRNAARPQIVWLQLAGLCAPLAVAAFLDEDKSYSVLSLLIVCQIVVMRSITRHWRQILRSAFQHGHDAVQQREALSLALNGIHHGLCMGDRAGRITLINARMRKLFDLFATPTPISLRDLSRAVACSAGLSVEGAESFQQRWKALAERKDESSLLVVDAQNRALEFRCERAGDDRFIMIVEDVTEQRKAVGEIEHKAHHDALTGLPNRLRFREVLESELRDLASSGRRLFVLAVELDRFKEVNDALGHSIGDALLRAVAKSLRQCAPAPHCIARFGGDEFFIMLDPRLAEAEAQAIAERIIATVKQPLSIEGQRVVVGASIGMAQAPRDGVTMGSLVKRADLAMYRAKALGGARALWFTADMEAALTTRRQLEVELHEALAKEQLVLHYQPIVDARDGRTTACEALVRWRHPQRGMISPAEFIPIAEETGLIVAMGEWVLRRACAEARTWSEDIRVAVNFSPKQFQQSDLVRVVAHALADAGLTPTRLEVEITESTLMSDADEVAVKFEALSAMGVRLSLDDFGTGYSSLGYLNRFPVQKLKMDRSFVRTLLGSRKTQAIVSAVSLLARELDIDVVAEGVETPEQLACLSSKDVFLIQGFLFSRPKPAEELFTAGDRYLRRQEIPSAA